MTKDTKNAIILILCVFSLVLILISIRFLPDKKSSNDLSNDVPIIKVLGELPDKINHVKILNNHGEYNFIKNKNNKLEIQDLIDAYLRNESAYDEFQELVSNLVAEKIVSEENPNPETFGFVQPKAQLLITYNNNTEAEILLGNQAPGEAGYYLMQKEKPQIYLISNDVASLFFKSKLDYISLSLFPSEDPEKELEHLELLGGSRPEKIRIIKASVSAKNKNKSEQPTYKVVEPVEANVLTDKNHIIESLENLTASKIEAINITQKDIVSYGLISPFAQINLKYKNQDEKKLILSKTFEPKSESESTADSENQDYFAMLQDGNIIYRISKYYLESADILLDDLIK